MRVLYNGIEIPREQFDLYKKVGFDSNGDLLVEPKTEADIKKDYEDAVVKMIRQRYSLDQELAILRQRDSKPQEFYEYNNYVELCKAEAKAKFNL